MSWKRKAGIGCGAMVLLIVLAIGVLFYFKPWIPEVQMAAPGETGRRITEAGLVANYFPAPGEGRHPAILLLGGSEGGLGRGSKRVALGLQREGFAVLQLSYYSAPGQPEKLELVPLEYFGRAVEWLAGRPEVSPDRIGVMGASRGTEAALLLATRRPEIRAVVAGMPSSAVWASIDWFGGDHGPSSWSEGGRGLPYLPYGEFDWAMRISALYEGGLEKAAQYPDAMIPVERTDAPVLLICGEADTLWPSCPMARQVKDRADRLGGPEVTILAYPEAGHAGFGLPLQGDHPGLASLGSMGGSNEGNNAARKEGWAKSVAFFKAALGDPAAPEG